METMTKKREIESGINMEDEIKEYLDQNVVTFSDADISAIAAIISKHLSMKYSPSYTINVPSLDEISQVEKATHTLTLTLSEESEEDDD
jgi:hypothetical protein